MYVVVRSNKEWELQLEGTEFESETGFTKYPNYETLGTDNIKWVRRRFYSVDEISNVLTEAGFKVMYTKEYKEYLYADYMRTKRNPEPNSLIELCVIK